MATKSPLAATGGKVHALLTGPPGIGKTTLVKKICSQLQQHQSDVGFDIRGFYTEEVRADTSSGRGSRVGFDIVSLDGTRAPLARTGGDTATVKGQSTAGAGSRRRKPAFVGKYCVDVESFEGVALPSLSASPSPGCTSPKRRLFVIDEIGKMELFSDSFVQTVKALFNPKPLPPPGSDVVVLATIPIARQRSHWLVEELRNRKDCLLFEVSERNRDSLVKEVSDFLQQNLTRR